MDAATAQYARSAASPPIFPFIHHQGATMLSIGDKLPPFRLKATVSNDLASAFVDIDRATLLVDPDGVIRFVYVTDLSVGRSPQEVLRVLDAPQTDALCPCNWRLGEDTLKAA
jgi:lipoyl-dependent peroxiredoxin subunit C